MWLLPGHRRRIEWINRHPVLGSLAFAVIFTAGMQVIWLMSPRYNWKLAVTLGTVGFTLVFLAMYVGVRKGWVR